jgi:hypothetical protein
VIGHFNWEPYTYTEATADEQLASWIGAHVRPCRVSFEDGAGVTQTVSVAAS